MNRSRDRKGVGSYNQPRILTYLLTFTCCGRHLHGAETGSVDCEHNRPGTPVLRNDATFIASDRQLMDQPPYTLDSVRRDAVVSAIREVCVYRGWSLLAVHARTTHVHVVVEAETEPEKVMSDFKAYASRRLDAMALDPPHRKRWARHGSTRWLWRAEHISAAVQYVVSEQGEAMSVFELE